MKTIIGIMLCLGLTGCAHYLYVAPDGTKAEATSWGGKELSGFESHFADGKGAERSLRVDSYSSEKLYPLMKAMLQAATDIAAKQGGGL